MQRSSLMRLHGSAWCVLALLFVASLADAQQPALAPYRARILLVVDSASGAPIEDADVTEIASGTSARTSREGTVRLAFLPDGGGHVRIRRLGYVVATRFIAITASDTLPVTVTLAPGITTLPGVVARDSAPRRISPGLRQFEERRQGGFGQFIVEEELRKSDNRALSDVVRRLHGIQINCSIRTPRLCFAASFRQSECTYAVYIDGMRMSDNNLLAYEVRQFAALEAHSAATTPPVYNSSRNGCGVLLLWSRER